MFIVEIVSVHRCVLLEREKDHRADALRYLENYYVGYSERNTARSIYLTHCHKDSPSQPTRKTRHSYLQLDTNMVFSIP